MIVKMSPPQFDLVFVNAIRRKANNNFQFNSLDKLECQAAL